MKLTGRKSNPIGKTWTLATVFVSLFILLSVSIYASPIVIVGLTNVTPSFTNNITGYGTANNLAYWFNSTQLRPTNWTYAQLGTLNTTLYSTNLTAAYAYLQARSTNASLVNASSWIDLLILENQTLWTQINVNSNDIAGLKTSNTSTNATAGNTWTKLTYTNNTANYLYSNAARTGSCPAGFAVQNTTTSGVQCVSVSSSGGGNTSWNESLANTLYYPLNSNPNNYINTSTDLVSVYTNITLLNESLRYLNLTVLALNVSNNSLYILVGSLNSTLTSTNSSLNYLNSIVGGLALNVSTLGNWSADKGAVYTNISLLNTSITSANVTAGNAYTIAFSTNATLPSIQSNLYSTKLNISDFTTTAVRGLGFNVSVYCEAGKFLSAFTNTTATCTPIDTVSISSANATAATAYTIASATNATVTSYLPTNLNQTYLDNRYLNGLLTLYFWNTTSTLNNSFTVMNLTQNTTTMTTSKTIVAGETEIARRIFTQYNLSQLSTGTYRQHTTANLSATARTIRLHSELYRYNQSNGTLVLIGSATPSDALISNTYQDVEWTGSLLREVTFSPNEYLVMILNATSSGGGGNPTLTVINGANTGARLEVGISPTDIQVVETDPIWTAASSAVYQNISLLQTANSSVNTTLNSTNNTLNSLRNNVSRLEGSNYTVNKTISTWLNQALLTSSTPSFVSTSVQTSKLTSYPSFGGGGSLVLQNRANITTAEAYLWLAINTANTDTILNVTGNSIISGTNTGDDPSANATAASTYTFASAVSANTTALNVTLGNTNSVISSVITNLTSTNNTLNTLRNNVSRLEGSNYTVNQTITSWLNQAVQTTSNVRFNYLNLNARGLQLQDMSNLNNLTIMNNQVLYANVTLNLGMNGTNNWLNGTNTGDDPSANATAGNAYTLAYNANATGQGWLNQNVKNNAAVYHDTVGATYIATNLSAIYNSAARYAEIRYYPTAASTNLYIGTMSSVSWLNGTNTGDDPSANATAASTYTFASAVSANTTALNITLGNTNSVISSVITNLTSTNATASTRAGTGNCAAGQVVGNVTTNGVQCLTVGGTGTVTSVATGMGLTGGPVTTAGTITVDPVSSLMQLYNSSYYTARAKPSGVVYTKAATWTALNFSTIQLNNASMMSTTDTSRITAVRNGKIQVVCGVTITNNTVMGTKIVLNNVTTVGRQIQGNSAQGESANSVSGAYDVVTGDYFTCEAWTAAIQGTSIATNASTVFSAFYLPG